MILPSTHKLVGCLSRLGSYTVQGPTTGKKLIILSRGTWIDAADAAALMESRIDVYCARRNEHASVCPVHYIEPTVDQVEKFEKEH